MAAKFVAFLFLIVLLVIVLRLMSAFPEMRTLLGVLIVFSGIASASRVPKAVA